MPIKGIKVTVNDDKYNHGFTNENGEFSFYASVPNEDYYSRMDSLPVHYTPDSVRIHFWDVDGIENGSFADTTIIINPDNFDEVKINVVLRESKK